MSALVFPDVDAPTLKDVLGEVPCGLARKLAPSFRTVEPMGCRAFQDKQPLSANPFDLPLHRAWWNLGWRRGEREAREKAICRARECALDGATSATAAAGLADAGATGEVKGLQGWIKTPLPEQAEPNPVDDFLREVCGAPATSPVRLLRVLRVPPELEAVRKLAEEMASLLEMATFQAHPFAERRDRALRRWRAMEGSDE